MPASVCLEKDASSCVSPQLEVFTSSKGVCSDVSLLDNSQRPGISSEKYSHVNVLSGAERESAMVLMYRDSYYSQTIVTLTTGIFLVGFALQLNAPNFIVGLLAAIPALAQLLQLPAVQLLRKTHSRRDVCVKATLISRLCLLPMAVAPWMPSSQMSVLLLLVAFSAHTCIGAFAACAWNAWLKDVVPADRLGVFFSRKLSLAMIITIALTVLGGYFIDVWSHYFPESKVYAYSFIMAIAGLVGWLGLPLLRKIPEPANVRRSMGQRQPPLLGMVRKPLRHANFRQLILFMSAWNFAVNLAAPFFAVYMLTMLGYSMALVTGLTIVSQVANLLFVRLWGTLADRYSNKSVLSVSAPLYIACVLGWTFIPYHGSIQETFLVALALHVLLGLASSGAVLASGNIALKLAPSGKSVEFLAVNSMASSLAAGIAPILGGLFADFFAHQELSFILHWHSASDVVNLKTLDFQYWDFFFVLAFLFGLLSLTRLARVQESGEVRKKIILRELVMEACRILGKLPGLCLSHVTVSQRYYSKLCRWLSCSLCSVLLLFR